MKIEFTCDNCGQQYRVNDEKAGRKVRCRQCEHVMLVPSIFDEEFPMEKTTGGSIVHRHEPRMREFELATGDEDTIEQITDHIERHIGPIDLVFHELVSDLIHVDVHWVQPTDSRPFHTLITSGMSERPMKSPAEVPDSQYAELMISLPPDWPISEEAFEDECYYWPIRWLKILARFPHEYETWLFDSHTVPNGDPPEPFADNADFCGWLLLPPILVSDQFWSLKVNCERTIRFFAIYPLYESEMAYKLKHGVDALIDRFDDYEVCEVVDVERENVCPEE